MLCYLKTNRLLNEKKALEHLYSKRNYLYPVVWIETERTHSRTTSRNFIGNSHNCCKQLTVLLTLII